MGKHNIVKLKRYKEVIEIDSNHSILNIGVENKLTYLLDEVQKATGIDPRDPGSKRSLFYSRTIYYKLAVGLTKFSYDKIASMCQKKHSTVIHSINNIWPEIVTYRPDLVEVYDRLIYDLDEHQFAELKVLRVQREMEELKVIVKNVKKEVNKNYFSLSEKLIAIKRAAYNVSSLLDI